MNELAITFADSLGKRPASRVSVSNIVDFIHKTEGFGGSSNDYYNEENSFLNRVIETRVGIPITLALIHIALGTRLGITVKGINFPGHFLVRYGDENHAIVDPFSGRTLSLGDCNKLIKQVSGAKLSLEQAHIEPASNKRILLRILDNLKNIYWKKKDWQQSQSCVERQMLLAPDALDYQVQLGTLYEMQGHLPLAQLTYSQVLEHNPDERLKTLVANRLLSMTANQPRLH